MPEVRWVMLCVFVANFICFTAVQNLENSLIFDKVTESLKVGTLSRQVVHE